MDLTYRMDLGYKYSFYYFSMKLLDIILLDHKGLKKQYVISRHVL